MINLKGKRILVTSGPTYAPLDAVRFIANRSSGRLGSVIAARLLDESAEVIQLAGYNSVTVEAYWEKEEGTYEIVCYETVDDLKQLLKDYLQNESIDAVLMAAAVLDYLPVETVDGKKSSGEEEWTVRLKRGEKLIEQLRNWSKDTLIVGFKLESNLSIDHLKERAHQLMERSDAMLVVANQVEDIDEERHIGYLVERDRKTESVSISASMESREEIAERLLERMSYLLK